MNGLEDRQAKQRAKLPDNAQGRTGFKATTLLEKLARGRH